LKQLFRKKDLLLPTILFIFAAYALYALVVVWCRRQRGHFLARRSQARPRWLTIGGGAILLGLFLWLLVGLAPAAPDQKIRLAGILGVSEGDVGLAQHATPPTASLELNQKPTNGQPAYALLHPASPPSLLPPAKPMAGSQLRKPKGKGASVREHRQPRVEPRLIKKDKASPKVKATKKKTLPPSSQKTRGSEGKTG
jgi:hypothetical protein